MNQIQPWASAAPVHDDRVLFEFLIIDCFRYRQLTVARSG
jgi:hypothetical protein